MKIISAVIVTGCRADCPKTRYYGKYGDVLGCAYAYGTLPEEDFAPWCPLQDKKED